jgi:hypothetical protein
MESGAVVLGLIVAWIAYRAGTRTGQARRTWGDWQQARGNERTFRTLRWVHTATAGWAWVFLAVALAVIIGLPGSH